MSSALSSAKNRRANQPPVILQGKTGDLPRQLSQQQQQLQQPPQNQSVGGLSLQQVIEIYGRRLNQLETFMNKAQSQQDNSSVAQSKSVQSQGNSSGPSLAQIQDLIDAKIRDYNDLLYSEIQPLRDGLESTKGVVPEVDFSEFHSRCQMLAEEIYQIKDIVMKLQAFTMSVNQKLAEKTGLLQGDNEEPEGGLTIPGSIIEDETEQEEDK